MNLTGELQDFICRVSNDMQYTDSWHCTRVLTLRDANARDQFKRIAQ